jgi:transposase
VIGNQNRWQEDFFVACSLSSLIPDDHILKQVDKVLDLSWLRKDVLELYCESNGRPSIDPEAAIRLMLAGFFQGIVHDRKLMREAQVNIAIRWFAGYRLDEKLPDHSSLTRIRQRWGPALFKQVFQRTVKQCVRSGLVNGDTVHVDATLIRADVSWESLTEEHAEKVIAENPVEQKDDSSDASKGKRTKATKSRKISTTDPEASMTTSSHTYHMEPFYKQHTAVDDVVGVIVDVDLTTGQDSEGKQLPQQIERIEENIGKSVKTITADSAYAYTSNYALLEQRKIEAIIPPQTERTRSRRIPIRRFKYDAKNKIVRCPCGRILRRSSRDGNGWIYRANPKDCRSCRLHHRCMSKTARARTILITDNYESLLRARRRRRDWDEKLCRLYRRHRWQVEGRHGEAKTEHGLRRAVRRGLANVAIQVYLTAVVMNLKRLAAFLWPIFALFKKVLSHLTHFDGSELQHQVNYSLEGEMEKSTWRYGL